MHSEKFLADVLMATFRRLLAALIAIYSFNSSAAEVPNLVDPVDADGAVDLAEVPLGADLLRIGALKILDSKLETQLSDEFQQLQSQIGQSITDNRGCLLKVRLFVNPESGAIAIPDGQLVALLGIGKTPADALANFIQTKALVGPDKVHGPFQNQSYYLWVKKEQGKLKAGAIPREFRGVVEKQAREEVERRQRLEELDAAVKSAEVESVSRDQFWSQLAEKHALELQHSAKRQAVQKQVHEFAVAQRRFNDAYQQYLEKEQELREQQQSMQTLQTISRIGSVVTSAIQLGEFASSANANAVVSAPVTGSAGAMIEYHQKQIDLLNGKVKEWGAQIDLRGVTLQRLNDGLVKTFEDGGIQIPDNAKTLAVPPKP